MLSKRQSCEWVGHDNGDLQQEGGWFAGIKRYKAINLQNYCDDFQFKLKWSVALPIWWIMNYKPRVIVSLYTFLHNFDLCTFLHFKKVNKVKPNKCINKCFHSLLFAHYKTNLFAFPPLILPARCLICTTREISGSVSHARIINASPSHQLHS